MVFHQDDLQFQLLGVFAFDEVDVVCKTYPRGHCAISLRIDADTDIEFQTETLHFETGDVAFFPPECGYTRRTRRDRMIVFHFNLIQGDLPDRVEILRGDWLERLQPMFEAALEEWNGQKPGYLYRTTAYLYQIFGEIQSRSSKTEIRNPTLRQAMAMFSECYGDSSLTITDIAQQMHVSGSYLRRIFCQEFGISPKQYLNNLRLERAKELLNAGYDSVLTVAEKVGFRDTKNFATAFKKQFGYPPSKQRYGFGEQ